MIPYIDFTPIWECNDVKYISINKLAFISKTIEYETNIIIDFIRIAIGNKLPKRKGSFQ